MTPDIIERWKASA